MVTPIPQSFSQLLRGGKPDTHISLTQECYRNHLVIFDSPYSILVSKRFSCTFCELVSRKIFFRLHVEDRNKSIHSDRICQQKPFDRIYPYSFKDLFLRVY